MSAPLGSLGRWINGLHRYSRIYLDRELRPLGMSGAQVPLMMALYHEGGLHQECLARRLHVDKATTTRALQRLEESGFVRRVRDEADRRAFRVQLTELGRQVEPRVKEALKGWTRLLSMGLTETELGLTRELLQRMFENVAAVEAVNNEREVA